MEGGARNALSLYLIGNTAMPAKAKPDDKAQSERFKEAARQVGADRDSDAAADQLMGRLAKQPPQPKGQKEKGSA
jgi:hypothetical protein